MMDIAPRQPHRPLIWPDFVLDLQEFLAQIPDEIYIVGGAVRDALLHRPLHDIDLATPHNAIKTARKIANHFNGNFFPLDSERDVGRVLLDLPDGRLVLDIARFRGETLLDDLTDRDFTLNALAVNIKSDLSLLIDPLNGEADIRNKLLRRCSDHALADDPIRALRAVRQSNQLGMRIEASTLLDLRHAIAELGSVSPERIRDEWFKLLSLPRPSAALRVVDRLGLLAVIMPGVMPLQTASDLTFPEYDMLQHTLAVVDYLTSIFNVVSYRRTDQTAASFGLGMLAIQLDQFRTHLITHLDFQWPNERPHTALMILAAMLHESGSVEGDSGNEERSASAAGVQADALRLSAAEKERLMTVIRNHQLPFSLLDTTPLSLYQFWKKLGIAGVDVCLFYLANYLANHGANLNQNDWLAVVDRVRILLDAWYVKHEQVVSPPALIDGSVLMKTFQLKPGPIIGEILERVRVAQVIGDVHTTDEAIRFVEKYLTPDLKFS